MKSARFALLLTALIACWGIGSYDLWAPDEPYFGEGAREMVVDGHWAVPHVNGEITTDKPPLFFWLIALFSLPSGAVTSFTARFPSVLAALVTVALTMRLGRRWDNSEAGALAGLILATSYMFWDKSRTAQIDALLCVLITAALVAFLSFRAGEFNGRTAGLLFWALTALAVLAKGPVGVLVPLGIALTTLIVDRDLRSWKRFAPLAGPSVFMVIIAAWIVFASVGGGGEYSVWGAFEKHVLNRAVHGMHHKQPPWYFLTVLPVQLLPWSALVPGALLLAWRRRSDPINRYLLAHALFVCVFFSIWTEKRNLYVLPAFPAFALLIARLVMAASRGESDQHGARVPTLRWVKLPLIATAAGLLVIGVALPSLAKRVPDGLVVPTLLPAVVVVCGGVVVLLIALRGAATTTIARSLAVAMAAVYLVVAIVLFPAFNPIKSMRAMGERVREVAGDAAGRGEPILAYDMGNSVQAIAFYSNGIYCRPVEQRGEFVSHLESPKPAFAVLSRKAFEALAPELRARLSTVTSSQMARGELLFVTNQTSDAPNALSR